jgi:hypothetical protein
MPVKFSRIWAMPSRETFTILPIAELVARYVGDGKGWADPFAGNNSPAEFTNDLNPQTRAKSHLNANDFANSLSTGLTGVIHDPPYSLRQLKECYDDIGASLSSDETKTFPWRVKEILAPKVRPGGLAICCGWNSGGFGERKGFELVEILMVPHGRSHNDTIVTVERKMNESLEAQAAPEPSSAEVGR